MWLLKLILICVFCLTSVIMKPLNNDFPVVVENIDNRNENGYNFKYKLSDGQYREETGTLNQIKNCEDSIIFVEGSYSFIDKNGHEHVINYKADNNGYKSKLDTKPSKISTTPPPTPASVIGFQEVVYKPPEITCTVLECLTGRG